MCHPIERGYAHYMRIVLGVLPLFGRIAFRDVCLMEVLTFGKYEMGTVT